MPQSALVADEPYRPTPRSSLLSRLPTLSWFTVVMLIVAASVSCAILGWMASDSILRPLTEHGPYSAVVVQQ